MVDPWEDPVGARPRALTAELGVSVQLGREVFAADPAAWRLSEKYVMRLWTAQVTDGEPQALVEHDELRWLGRGEWLTVPWLDADVPIVRALLDQVARR